MNNQKKMQFLVKRVFFSLVMLALCAVPASAGSLAGSTLGVGVKELIMTAVLLAVSHFFSKRKRNLLVKVLSILCVNTGWLAFYALYLLLLVPDGIREVSVISNTDAFITFFLVYSFFTSLLLFGVSLISQYVLKPITALENKVSVFLSALSYQSATCIKIAVAAYLLVSNLASC